MMRGAPKPMESCVYATGSRKHQPCVCRVFVTNNPTRPLTPAFLLLARPPSSPRKALLISPISLAVAPSTPAPYAYFPRLLVLASLRLIRLRPAFLSTTMDTSQVHNPEEASEAEPTIEEIKEWNRDKLLEWIQRKRPGLLEDDNLETFKNAFISGNVFAKHGCDVGFFRNGCNLPIGISYKLVDLGGRDYGRGGRRYGTEREEARY
jgi:hypothetical protein